MVCAFVGVDSLQFDAVVLFFVASTLAAILSNFGDVINLYHEQWQRYNKHKENFFIC